VVEVAVRQEQVVCAGELAGAAPGVERQTGRIQPEPGLLAGDRVSFERELAVPPGVRGPESRPNVRRQISW